MRKYSSIIFSNLKEVSGQQVYIVGSRGIPSSYGGFETFVENLVIHEELLKETDGMDGADNSGVRQDVSIRYHVACLDMGRQSGNGTNRNNPADGDSSKYHGAECFRIKCPNLRMFTAPLYDVLALRKVVRELQQREDSYHQNRQALITSLDEENHRVAPVVYVLACRIGPVFPYYVRQLHRLGAKVVLNPDGHEWKRKKWHPIIRLYWKISESIMVRHADHVVCDCRMIERYIQQTYTTGAGVKNIFHRPSTSYIPYGADPSSVLTEADQARYQDWLEKNGLREHAYFLSISRLVPENNFETIIREYMASDSPYHLVMLTTPNAKLKQKLARATGYPSDGRILFLPAEYDMALTTQIRAGALAYLHGHEVGGTNPTLLQSLACARENSPVVLALDVPFHREVCGTGAKAGALYWTKDSGSLRKRIELVVDACRDAKRAGNTQLLKATAAYGYQRIGRYYTWEKVCLAYRKLFYTLASQG